MNKLFIGTSSIALMSMMAVPAIAQEAQPEQARSGGVDTIVVTATKREETTQDIPVTVNALGEETLDELGVDVFTDYLVQLPGVTSGGSGPGQNTIYIRGLASTTPNLTVAGVAGLAPNVAFYLDEQPLAQPGRNLDVYAVDLQRVEVLPGPQGTLFGASSQAGTVRLITNKPVLGEFQAKANFGTFFTQDGDMSNKVEAVINVPVTDKLALRGVVYTDKQGGYIDNVNGIRTARESARFRSAGTVRDNGVAVSPRREGFQADDDLSGVTFLEANNAALVEENINDTVYSGFRLAGRYEINPDWMLDVSHARQNVEADGVFFSDPELDDLEIQRYSDDEIEDYFHNTSWTLEGRVGALEALYTGAYTERETDQTIDYSDYLFVGQYLPYYICDGSVTYPSGDPSGTCQAPNLFVKSNSRTEVSTHELRFNTPSEARFRATFGAFYSDLELAERNDFTYPGSTMAVGFNGEVGFAPNFPLTNGAATPGDVGNESQGYFSDPGPFPEGVIFRNDVLRTDEQFGVFGEATYDLIPNTLALTVGARWYDIEVDLEGSANSSFFNLGQDSDAQLAGTNISAQYAPDNPDGNPDKAATDGTIYKVTGEWTPNDDMLFYATYSEGFRPGLLNRPGGATTTLDDGSTFTVPFVLDTDEVTNYEFGWKTNLFDNALQLNGSAFFVEVERLQTTIFDPEITNLFFSDNAADAEIKGVEADFTYVPYEVPGLTIAGAFSILDTEITEKITPTDDIVVGDPLAYAPEFQGNIRARYEWDLNSEYRAHVMPQLVYSDESFSDIIQINKAKIDSWTTLGFTAGVTTEKWSAEAFVDNLTDERAELANDFVFDRERVTVMRPRTYGLRFSVEY